MPAPGSVAPSASSNAPGSPLPSVPLEVTGRYDPSSLGIGTPLGIAMDAAGDVYVSDTLNQVNVNRVNYSNTNQSVVVDLAGGTATGSTIGSDSLTNIQQVNGSSANDTLAGSDSTLTEQFRGYAGNDRINGRGGIDIARYDINPDRTDPRLA